LAADIPSDSWTYPMRAVTPYLLRSPALHVLDNGQVLIAGGLKITSTGHTYNELTMIFDPASQTISSVENNPVSVKLAETATNNLWWDFESTHLFGLENGKVLLIGTGGQGSLKTTLATLFDPTTNSYTPISGENDVTYFYDSWCKNIDPIKFSDGRIFLGATILSSDLSTAVPIDLSSVDGKACYFGSDMVWDRAAQLLLQDENILFVSQDNEANPVSFMFEGNSYRLTRYQPSSSFAVGNTTMFYQFDHSHFENYGEELLWLKILPGTGASAKLQSNKMLEFIY